MPQPWRTLIAFPAVVGLLLAFATGTVQSQVASCGQALQQLQHYALRVNQIASFEHQTGIPMRCSMHTGCVLQGYQQLNAWYVYQSGLVNGWYAQLAAQCSRSASRPTVRHKRVTPDSAGGLDTEPIEQLTVDDEDRSVAIRIPSTPRGFAP